MHHRAGDHIEDQVGGQRRRGLVLLDGQFPALLRPPPALEDEVLLAVHDRVADPGPQGLVAGRLRDHRHQRGLGLRPLQQRGELQHHRLHIGGQAAQVRQFQLVEEHRHGVHDQFVLARPAPVERRLGDSRSRRHVTHRQFRPAEVDQRGSGGLEDRLVGRGTARASRS